MPRYGGLVLLGALTLGATLLRLGAAVALAAARAAGAAASRAFVSRARLRELPPSAGSNFLVHMAQKIVFSTDVIVVGIVLGSAASGIYSVPREALRARRSASGRR